MRVIELDTAETYYSLRDRILRGCILRGPRERIALVVPPRAAVMEGVGLPLLRRLADRERLEIGLVTADGELARRARRAGLPAFASLGLAQHYRPGWWRGRRRAEWLGLPVGGAPPPAATGRAAVPLAIALILLALALTAAAAVYTLPRATVTLRPATQPAQAIVELADVPARPVALSQSWEATAAGTGAAARQSARALALQALNAAAPAVLAARLAPGEQLVPGATRVTLAGEEYTTARGQTRLALTATLEGTAVDTAEVNRRVLPELGRALPAGYAVDPATLVTRLEPGSAAGRLVVTATATGRAVIDANALAAQLAGQRTVDVGPALAALLLAEPARLDLSLGPLTTWLPRLPFRPAQIQVEVLP